MCSFEFIRTNSAEVAVPSHGIVEIINVLRQAHSGSISIRVDMPFDVFLLQAAKEGLGYSVVPTVSPPTHARLKVIDLAKAPPSITAILSALV
jgi:hypothetical protein